MTSSNTKNMEGVKMPRSTAPEVLNLMAKFFEGNMAESPALLGKLADTWSLQYYNLDVQDADGWTLIWRWSTNRGTWFCLDKKGSPTSEMVNLPGFECSNGHVTYEIGGTVAKKIFMDKFNSMYE